MSKVYIVTRHFGSSISDVILGVFTTVEKAIYAMIADMERRRTSDHKVMTPSYEEVLEQIDCDSCDCEIYFCGIYQNYFSIYCKSVL
jgi:hypothetical protein